jgi:hypothetical protein
MVGSVVSGVNITFFIQFGIDVAFGLAHPQIP